MQSLPKVKKCCQKCLNDDGFGDWDREIEEFLDRSYEDWQHPRKTYMVPPVFEDKHRGADGNDGEKTEKNFFHLLQKFGESRAKLREGMFVIHSYKFKEMITECNKNQTKPETRWLLGEHDFVLLHPVKGIVFFQVKAASKTKGKFALANNQLDKDKQSLHAFAVAHLQGKKKRSVDKELHVYPGFVVMPNCARPLSEHTPENGIFKEDCETVESFANWWDTKISRKGAISQEVFNCLVMRFVGMSHLKPWRGLCINDDDRTMILQTRQQMKVLAGYYSPVLWIRGPAGSGKTCLLIEQAVTLANDILNDQSKKNEKILVLCFNSILCKALGREIRRFLQVPEATNVSTFLHCKTFTKLVMELACLYTPPKTRFDKERSVNVAVEKLENLMEAKNDVCMYDHILVDEGQDLYGTKWPRLLQCMHRSFQSAPGKVLARPGFFWVMYDMNQYLYFAKEEARSHFAYIQNSAPLNIVLRNTDNVFKQSKKYFNSLMSNDSPIKLGHGVTGLPIEWDDSLVSNSVEIQEGARLVVNWIEKLQKEKVRPKDICILVENKETQSRLRSEMAGIGVESQTGDHLVEESRNCAVVESIRRFKGLESKVVILCNPPFQGFSQFLTRELLYTAVSRCSCFLVVISTKEGCDALKSDIGISMR